MIYNRIIILINASIDTYIKLTIRKCGSHSQSRIHMCDQKR